MRANVDVGPSQNATGKSLRIKGRGMLSCAATISAPVRASRKCGPTFSGS